MLQNVGLRADAGRHGKLGMTWAMVCALGLAIVACEDNSKPGCPDGGLCTEQQATAVFEPRAARVLDLLLIIDEAALVDNRADQLRATLKAVGPYLRFRFDAQVAVISARPDGGASTGPTPSLWPVRSATCGPRWPDDFLRATTTCGHADNFEGPLDDQFACAIGEPGAAPPTGPGRPIEALVGLLGAATSRPPVEDFLRSEGTLSIGIVTSGDDPQAAGPTAQVLQAALARVKGDDINRVHLHAFVAVPDCSDVSRTPEQHAPNLAAFLQRFPTWGLSTSCQRDWPSQFQHVAPDTLPIGVAYCLPGRLADRDPTAPDIQPECVLEELTPTPPGGLSTTIIPRCAPGPIPDAGPDTQPCWTAVPDLSCNSGLNLVVNRSCTPAVGTVQRLSCAVTD